MYAIHIARTTGTPHHNLPKGIINAHAGTVMDAQW